ncbi:MarR family winged helix-turn-helix transcriptional regulator [Actinomadura keratinilytica]
MATRTDPLTLEVVELIGAVVARYHEEYDRAAAEQALTGAQARVLGLLSIEAMPMRQIARRLKCEPSNVTGIVDRLALRGLVERRADPGDRRIKVAALTAEGLRLPGCSGTPLISPGSRLRGFPARSGRSSGGCCGEWPGSEGPSPRLGAVGWPQAPAGLIFWAEARIKPDRSGWAQAPGGRVLGSAGWAVSGAQWGDVCSWRWERVVRGA